MSLLDDSCKPLYVCHYRDGTKRTGSYIQTLEWFKEASTTGNPCTIRPRDFINYKAP